MTDKLQYSMTDMCNKSPDTRHAWKLIGHYVPGMGIFECIYCYVRNLRIEG